MKVSGSVRMIVWLGVSCLETDHAYVDKWGNVKVSDADMFFLDWENAWEKGQGELGGCADEQVDLEIEEKDYDVD